MSLKGFIDPNPTRIISLHPWKHDLRAMSKMLEGEIQLPHLITHYNRKAASTKKIITTSCTDCMQALHLRQQYQQELLSKEK